MAEPSTPLSSDLSCEELAATWNTICELLGVREPSEAISRIETLTEQLDALDARGDFDDRVTLSEFEQVLTRLHKNISDLRARNAELEERLNTLTQEDDDGPPVHALLDALNVADYSAALDRIQVLKQRINALYQDREAIREAGHEDAESLIEAANALQRENERLRRDARNTSPDTEVLQSASAIRMVLGVSNIKEAEGFVERIDALSTSVRRALDHMGLDVPQELSVDHAEDVASFIDVLANQIDRLADAPLPDDEASDAVETLNAINSTLGISSVEDAREMETMVRNLTEDLNAIAHEREVLREEGLTAEQAVSMIHSMEEQLDDLYVQQDKNETNGALPPGLQDTLGVESIDEARRIVELTEDMDTQIATLYEEQEQLEELGIDSINEAVQMIQDMNEQLVELYENVEARESASALASDVHQDTFQQLESLYARQEKLQAELGISDPEAIVQMVEDMSVQLEMLYEDRDATLQPEDRDTDSKDEDLDDAERLEKLIDSMVQQLETLYSEKETLAGEGFDSAEEATARIDALRDEIQALREEKTAPATDVDPDAIREWTTLKNELGIEDPQEIRSLIDASGTGTASGDEEQQESAQSDKSANDMPYDSLALSDTSDEAGASSSVPPADRAAAPSRKAQPDPEWHAAPALADAELRAELPTMDDDARNALDLPVIQLDDDGCITALNDAAYALPLFDRLRSKSDAHNAHFFFDLAPSAATDAFYGRFHAGLDQQHLNACFPHLFSAPAHPPFVSLVHLYYDPDSATAWVLLRTA